jgi:hypothetical protein
MIINTGTARPLDRITRITTGLRAKYKISVDYEL